jgi:hypothetical protein
MTDKDFIQGKRGPLGKIYEIIRGTCWKQNTEETDGK